MKKILSRCIGRGALLCLALSVAGCGEPYSEHGHTLFSAAIQSVIDDRYCRDTKDCYEKMEITGGHGNKVNFSIYGVKDRKVMRAYIGFILEHGIRITNGVPISISVYPKPRNAYVNHLFVRRVPIIKVEIDG